MIRSKIKDINTRVYGSLEDKVACFRKSVNKAYDNIIEQPKYIMHRLLESHVTVSLEEDSFKFQGRDIKYSYVLVTCPFSDVLQDLKDHCNLIRLTYKNNTYRIKYIASG